MRGLNYNTRKRHRTTDPDLDNEDPKEKRGTAAVSSPLESTCDSPPLRKRQKGNNQGKRSQFPKGTNGMNLNYPTRKRDQTTDPHLDDEDPEEKRGTTEAGSPLESTWDSPLLRKRQKGDNQGKSSEFPKGTNGMSMNCTTSKRHRTTDPDLNDEHPKERLHQRRLSRPGDCPRQQPMLLRSSKRKRDWSFVDMNEAQSKGKRKKRPYP